jgi:hypothetical protein
LGQIAKLESRRRNAALPRRPSQTAVPLGRPQSGSRRWIQDGSPLTPELRDFIDRAIVPALVRLYLAELDVQNQFAKVEEAKADKRHGATLALGETRDCD